MLRVANLGPSKTMCLATLFVQFHGSCCLFLWLNVCLAVPTVLLHKAVRESWFFARLVSLNDMLQHNWRSYSLYVSWSHFKHFEVLFSTIHHNDAVHKIIYLPATTEYRPVFYRDVHLTFLTGQLFYLKLFYCSCLYLIHCNGFIDVSYGETLSSYAKL